MSPGVDLRARPDERAQKVLRERSKQDGFVARTADETQRGLDHVGKTEEAG